MIILCSDGKIHSSPDSKLCRVACTRFQHSLAIAQPSRAGISRTRTSLTRLRESASARSSAWTISWKRSCLRTRSTSMFFGIGEHHRSEFVDSAPVVILGAAATRTKNVRLSSAVTILSTADPVRVFQEFATLDLISHGRAEIVAGRGSSVEAFPLFGFDLDDYDSLFAEKLDLLLQIRDHTHIHWTGKHRPALTGQAVYPRPLQDPLPIWVGVGGTPASFDRAGMLGLPLMVAII